MSPAATPSEVSLEVRLNPAVMLFLNESETTIKPRLVLGASRAKFALHGINEGAPASAAISELRQAIATQHEGLDVRIARGVDVFCVAPESGPRLFRWLVRLLDEALVMKVDPDLQIRLHYLATLSESRGEIPEWLATVPGIEKSSGIRGGGVYLVSDYFRGVAVDRLRSYPVLARTMQVMALTGASRPATAFRFSGRRGSSKFGLFVAGLESYCCPPFRASAEYLMDKAIWLHMLEGFSSELQRRIVAYKGEFSPSCIEHWLLQVGRNSADLRMLVQSLNDARDGSPQNTLLEGLALDVTRSTANAAHFGPPQPPGLHAFEKLFPLFEIPVLLQEASRAASELLETFPLPLHPFFVRQHPSVLSAEICRERSRACDQIVGAIAKEFRGWALRSHSEWLPWNRSEARDIEALSNALRLPGIANCVHQSCHLDPSVSRDSREELCAGLESIQFLHLAAISR